jgi:hypothetical protein
MKKLWVILVAVIICLPGFSGNNRVDDGNEKTGRKRTDRHLIKVNALLEEEQIMDANYSDINSYSRHGKVFVKLLLYEENKPTKKMAYMEVVGTWNNLKLVRLPVTTIGIISMAKSVQYYLYDGSNFHLQLDDRTLKNTCNAFGLDYAKL